MHLILKIFPTFLLIIIYISAHSQVHEKVKISGQIIDSKTGQPIPYAHVRISNTAIGTITNTEGFFALNIPYQFHDHSLTITSIGYEKRILNIEDIKKEFLTIKLLENVTKLNEVVISTAEDIALKLVKTAVKYIPKNYPNHPEMLHGFYREISSRKNKTKYVIESVLEAYKESYENPGNKGSTRVVKARKYESKNQEKFQVMFYGTGHAAHSFDFVMSRNGPLNLKKIDSYRFRIIDTIQYNNEAVIKISFQPEKDKNVKGRGILYITLKTKAFVRGEYSYNAQEVAFMEKASSLINGYKRLNKQYLTEYKKLDSTWHISVITYSTNFLTPNGDTLKLNELFSVSNINQNPSEIAYADQLQFGDVFLEHTGEYDPDFWEEYDIVVPEQEIESLFRTQKQDTAREELTLRDILKGFKGSISLFATSAEAMPMTIQYINNGFTIDSDIPQRSYYYLGLSSTLEMELTPQLFIGIENRESFGKHRHQTFTVKLGGQKQFNLSGRPIYLIPSVNIGYYRYGYLLDSFENTGDLSIKGKKFDSSAISVSLESRRLAVEPMLRLSFERSHRLSLFAEAGWAFALKNWDGLFLKEDEGFLFWKKGAFLNASDSDLFFSDAYDKADKARIKPNITANIGITLSL